MATNIFAIIISLLIVINLYVINEIKPKHKREKFAMYTFLFLLIVLLIQSL